MKLVIVSTNFLVAAIALLSSSLSSLPSPSFPLPSCTAFAPLAPTKTNTRARGLTSNVDNTNVNFSRPISSTAITFSLYREDYEEEEEEKGNEHLPILEPTLASTTPRRNFLSASLLLLPTIAASASSAAQEAAPFVRTQNDFSYKFTPPPDFSATNKPLKTHLDEINFSKEGVRGYTYGITVDPVRLQSLSQFGTPEEVAAKIVMAEVNRDGVFDVTLAKDPVENARTGAYEIDYVSDGKRGKKRFVTRTLVRNGKLFVLTAQVKEEQYGDLQEEVLRAVDSFEI